MCQFCLGVKFQTIKYLPRLSQSVHQLVLIRINRKFVVKPFMLSFLYSNDARPTSESSRQCVNLRKISK